MVGLMRFLVGFVMMLRFTVVNSVGILILCCYLIVDCSVVRWF